MTKYRSKNDYAQIYGGDKQGFNTGLEGFLYLRKETTARSFLPPRIGTQGKSVGAAAAITDISALTSPTLKIALRGAAALSVTLTPAGNTTGTLVAAALESAINTALQAIGSDHRVWTLFASGDSHYEIYDQETGTLSSVVITDGATNDVATALKLGTTHAGVETVGTDDSDYLLMTTGGPKFMQTVESNQHRSGRFHSGIVKKKKTAEFDFETYVNMGGTAGASIDNSIALLLENVLGTKVVNSGTNIIFTQGLPNFTMSLVRVSTVFGEYYTGSYTKGMELKFPGNGPATNKYTGKAAQASISGIAQILGAVSASASVILQAGQATRYSAPQYLADGTTVASAPLVAIVAPDGRTILAGADGTLSILGINLGTDTLTLSSAVTVGSLGFVVPFDPGAVQKTGTDDIYTDLHGSFQFDTSAAAVDVTELTLSYQNNHNDLDDRFGRDTNVGFIAGNRAEIKLTVKFDLSAGDTLGTVIQTRAFAGFAPKLILGDGSTARKMTIEGVKWIVTVPAIDVPQNGPTPVTLEGMLYQSAPGAQDPIKITFS